MDYSSMVSGVGTSLSSFMLPLAIFAFVLMVGLAFMQKKLKALKGQERKKEKDETKPSRVMDMMQEGSVYRSITYLLTGHERTFYENYLKKKFDGYQIVPKVRVADVIAADEGLKPSEKMSAFRTISQWHFDFVVIDQEFKILGAVELDDASHDRKARIERDTKLNEICKNAGVQLYRYRMKNGAFMPQKMTT